ncbi:MAG: hypothetical protein EXR07_03380 [Acetobacteraceae bacterium]|nr:hypothetical protein [Acetobacteraceae bacterium]
MDMHTWRANGRGVFICGSPYTEVSSLAWALTAHRAFWTSSESRFLYRLFGSRADLVRPYLYDTYRACAEEGAWLRTNAVSYPEFLAALGDGIGRLFQGRAGKKRWVDSSPENALLIEELLYMFPDAAFVGMLQSSRTSVFIEMARHAALTPPKVRELVALNTLYGERLKRAGGIAPDRVYLLEERDLFDNPEAALADLLDFLGEENNPDVAEKFARRLLRLNLPLAEAREKLAQFKTTLLADTVSEPPLVTETSPPLEAPPSVAEFQY